MDQRRTISTDLGDAPVATTIPYTKAFTSTKAVNATLQANGSGTETIEVDKINPLAPKVYAYNNAGTAVSGAKVDVRLQGY